VKAADVALVALVGLLALFVGAQATTQRSAGLGAQSATDRFDRAAAPRQADPAGDAPPVARTANGRASDHASPELNTALATGRAEQRLAVWVTSVPRPPALAPRDLQRRLRLGAEGTYIEALLLARDSVLSRWPDRLASPLRVWIGDGGLHEGWHPTFPEAVRDAFMAWSATGIPVHVTFLRDSTGADVRVRFVPSFPDGISGRTIWSRDAASWLVAGDIDLALTLPGGEPLTRAQLHAIALHEIGHLLGLDHVDAPEHIMAPHVRARSLSTGDAATVRLLYSLPAGSARN
jgi:hypothetical protein